MNSGNSESSVLPKHKSELILALDRPSLSEGLALLDRLPAEVDFVKVGLELFIAEGPAAISALQKRQKRIFLDLKLHDIPNTVSRAVASAAKMGVDLLTLHAGGGGAMLRAAADMARNIRDREGCSLKLVAVTMLTSLNATDLPELGIQRNLPEQVLALGSMALKAGMDGLVCSVHEAALLRQHFGQSPVLVTPGIRLQAAGSKVDGDQKRIATPTTAIQAGASFLVVGRPILDAPDPAAAARAILSEMDQTLAAQHVN